MPIYFLFRDGEARHVIAETCKAGPLILLPEPTYRRVAADEPPG